MPSRHPKCPLPRLWLFTDERVTDTILLQAINALPRGSGIVFRHYRLAASERRALFARIRTAARRKRIILLLAGNSKSARGWKADGVHLSGKARSPIPPPARKPAIVTLPAHNARELGAARHARADLVFLSPVFPSRSHPGGNTLGPLRFAALARLAPMPVVALGGMTTRRFRRLKRLGAYGWAAIDGLTPSQRDKKQQNR